MFGGKSMDHSENAKEFLLLKKYFQEEKPAKPLTKEQFIQYKNLENASSQAISNRYSSYLFSYYRQYRQRIERMIEEERENGYPKTREFLSSILYQEEEDFIDLPMTEEANENDIDSPSKENKKAKQKKESSRSKEEDRAERKLQRKDRRFAKKYQKREKQKQNVKIPMIYKVVALGFVAATCVSTFSLGYSFGVTLAFDNLKSLLLPLFFATCAATSMTDASERFEEEDEEEMIPLVIPTGTEKTKDSSTKETKHVVKEGSLFVSEETLKNSYHFNKKVESSEPLFKAVEDEYEDLSKNVEMETEKEMLVRDSLSTKEQLRRIFGSDDQEEKVKSLTKEIR